MESCRSKSEKSSEPGVGNVFKRTKFRFTQLWNELLEKFRLHVKCKEHRRMLKSHPESFTGSSAADALHYVLQQNKEVIPNAKREQAIKLLQHYLANHIIETVTGKWKNEVFRDSRRLYKFFTQNGNSDRSQNNNDKPSRRGSTSSLRSRVVADAGTPLLLNKILQRFLPACLSPQTD